MEGRFLSFSFRSFKTYYHAADEGGAFNLMSGVHAVIRGEHEGPSVPVFSLCEHV